MTYNLNLDIRIKLTPKGVFVLEEFHREQIKKGKREYSPFKLPEVDKDGYSKFRTSDVFEIFGGYSWLCNEPFSMEIELLGTNSGVL